MSAPRNVTPVMVAASLRLDMGRKSRRKRLTRGARPVTRDWYPITIVTLNPEREPVITAAETAAHETPTTVYAWLGVRNMSPSQKT
jgi:hypothetical protein